MRTENCNLRIYCIRHIIILFSNNEWELVCEQQKHQYFTGSGDDCLSSIEEWPKAMQFWHRTLDKVLNSVTDMNYSLLGTVPLQTSTQMIKIKQFSEMLICNLTLTWLSSERMLLHFFTVKSSCLMDTSYTWIIWLYKQLLGRLGPCWREQVKRHIEETGKRLARGTRKYFVTVNKNEEFFFGKVTPFVTTAVKTATVMKRSCCCPLCTRKRICARNVSC